MRSSRRLGLAAALLVSLVGAPAGRSEDRVTVRGAYFREHSTRVVQPMVQVSKLLPHGLDAGGHFLVDAITSASVAAGALQDALFTEYRKEAGFFLGKTWDRTRVGLAYRQSREPDYISHTGGVSVSQGVWENTGTVAVNLAYGEDTIGPNLNQALKVYFGSASYTQALSPTLLAQVGYEAIFLDGFQANPYIQVPNLGREGLPLKRLRHVAVGRVARFFPALDLGVQLHYRLYVDQGFQEKENGPANPWGLGAHTVEGRVYKTLTPTLEARLSYRYHTQGAARFWCNTDPSRGGQTDCYGPFPAYYSADAKLGPLGTHAPELKLTWEAGALRGVPVLGWFYRGAFEISYAHYFQSTRYENAHLLQTGYSLAF